MALVVAQALSVFWKLIPFRGRKVIISFLMLLESRGRFPDASLKRLFAIEDFLTVLVNERALALGEGEHPKHSLMNYHDFFIQNLVDCRTIIDIGCGYGAVSRSVAEALPRAKIVGIDNSLERIQQAKESTNPGNLEFQYVSLESIDNLKDFDGIILSNVIEHLENRIEVLRVISGIESKPKIIVRVPNFERHWTVPMRKQLGVNYFLDNDHKIEHSVAEFVNEMELAGLKIVSMSTLWGEIWAVCKSES